jgi:XXXCH domain-containing protein
MASNERKIQAYMTREQTAEYLRSLARAVEGEPVEAMVPEMEGFKKLKLSLEPAGDRYSMKCSVKHPKAAAAGEEAPAGEQSPPKYKELKKRMKSDFKLILEAARQGRLPDPRTVEGFVADSDLMVTYPDKGDPFYDIYARTTRELAETFATGDVDAFAAVCEKMDQIKHECHERYK